MVTDRMSAGTTPYEKIKDDIKYYLETQKQVEILKKFTAGELKNAKIEYLNESYNPAAAKKAIQKAEETKKAGGEK